MNHLKKILMLACLMAAVRIASAQDSLAIDRIEPPFWWAGMASPDLQLMVHAKGIGDAKVSVGGGGALLVSSHKVKNNNYVFIDLNLAKAQAGKVPIVFERNGKKTTIEYELKARNGQGKQGFNPSDAIYLLMPDRFANGDPGNDHAGMREKPNREELLGRHGGDLKGIQQRLDYIKDLGFTALWLNPVQENNMAAHSYHGYAITDFYKVDPRLGSNDDYLSLVNDAHGKGMKVIMDMVFNHAGDKHWWMEDMPMETWFHQHETFTRSNFRAETVSDPHASEADKTQMLTGWFDTTMPDFDQRNPFVANYLIQNSIWWVEYAGLDGIRMDTYPYPYKDFMAAWAKRIMLEYPKFNIVGESWMQKVSHEAFWQKDAMLFGYQSNLPSVTDFPVYHSISSAFHEGEGWLTGMANIYYTICQDFLYADPNNLVTFADNHDVNRVFTQLGRDYRKFKMAMTFLLTTRGIPQVYYGTEILMEGDGSNHGLLRKDMPGGWAGDAASVFEMKGLAGQQQEAYQFLKRLLNWRKASNAIHKGKLMHFIPENGIYVYFRYTDNEAVMVMMNNNEGVDRKVDTARFAERMKGYTTAVNVETGQAITNLKEITMSAKTAIVLELKK